VQDSIERTFSVPAPVERVWKALSDYREFGKWFRATIGAPFTRNAIVHCQSTYPGHEHLGWDMTIVEIEKNTRLIFTWQAYYGEDADRDGALDPPLTVTFELEKQAGGTLIKLSEIGFSKLPEKYSAIALQMNTSGWDQQIENIVKHLSN